MGQTAGIHTDSGIFNTEVLSFVTKKNNQSVIVVSSI